MRQIFWAKLVYDWTLIVKYNQKSYGSLTLKKFIYLIDILNYLN
jgi:hypothetical protein